MKQIFEVSVKTFCRKWEGEFLPKWCFIFKQLEKMPKRIPSGQSEFDKFLQSYLLTTSNISYFSTKKGSAIILKMKNFWRKNLGIFHDVKKIEFYFSCNTFVSYYLLTRIYRDGIKNIFHNIWGGFFKWQK